MCWNRLSSRPVYWTGYDNTAWTWADLTTAALLPQVSDGGLSKLTLGKV